MRSFVVVVASLLVAGCAGMGASPGGDNTGRAEVKNAAAPTSERLRVLVAAEERLVAEALMFTLDTDPKVEAIGYAVNGWEALDYIWALNPDAVVVGPQLAGLDALGFCRFTHELFPDVLLVML